MSSDTKINSANSTNKSLTPKTDKDNFGKANPKDQTYATSYDKTLDVDPNSSKIKPADSADGLLKNSQIKESK